MDERKQSGLRFYSLGIVLVDKPAGTDFIQVDPIEDFVLDDGKIKFDDRKYNITLRDHKDIPRNSTIVGGSMVEAKWIPFGDSNRDTAPDVRYHETVMLWRFNDDQKYYWTTMFREPTLRKLERVRYSYSNRSGDFQAYDDDTSYWVEISTIDQHIVVKTSGNQGEAASYEIKIDAGGGSLTIKDDLDNSIELNSKAGTLVLAAKNSVVINTGAFIVNAGSTVLPPH